MKYNKILVLTIVALASLLVVAGDTSVMASLSSGAEAARGTSHQSNLFTSENSIFRTVTDILLFILGAIAVIMLIIGGIRYVVSGGNQAAVTAAKNTILYAIVGIVVAFLAYAAVDFVIEALAGSTGGIE